MNTSAWLVLSTYVMWGVFPVFWKLLSGVNAFYTLASRVLWSLVFSVIVLLFARGRKMKADLLSVFRNKREWGLLALAGVLVTVNWGSYIWGVAEGRLLDTSLAYFLEPIVMMLFGVLFFARG